MKFSSVASTFKSHFTIIITLYQRYFFVVVDIYIIETQIQVIILYVLFHNSAPYETVFLYAPTHVSVEYNGAKDKIYPGQSAP